MSEPGDDARRSSRSRRREPPPRIGADDRALAEAVVANLERFGRSAARIVARGRDAFLDREDDLLRRAGRSVVIDVSAAVDRLPEAVRDAHPEIPWRAIRTARNIVAHACDDVNEEYIWEGLRTGIPQLLDGLRGYAPGDEH